MPEIKEVRMYESEVINRVSYLLEAQFQEVPKIMERANETVKEFRDGCKDFEEVIYKDIEDLADSSGAQGA